MKKFFATKKFAVALVLALVTSVGTFGVANAADLGVDWSNATMPTGVVGLNSVAYGDGVFVGVNVQGDILRSTDGKTWTKKLGVNGVQFNAVAFGNHTFALIGYDPTNYDAVGYYSADSGLTYNTTSGISGRTYDVKTLTYGNGLFLGTVGDGNAGKAIYSPDGQTWTWGNNNLVQTVATVGVAYGNGVYATVSDVGTIECTADPDNSTWSLVSNSAFDVPPTGGGTFSQVVFDGAKFFTLFSNGSVSRLYSSTNCSSWTSLATAGISTKKMYALAWDGAAWLAGAGWTDTGIYRSVDGQSWTQVDANNTQWYGFALGNAIVVAGGKPQSSSASGLNSTIAVGWSTQVTPSPTPTPSPSTDSSTELANTGLSRDAFWIPGAVGSVLIAVGAVALLSIRRRGD